MTRWLLSVGLIALVAVSGCSKSDNETAAPKQAARQSDANVEQAPAPPPPVFTWTVVCATPECRTFQLRKLFVGTSLTQPPFPSAIPDPVSTIDCPQCSPDGVDIEVRPVEGNRCQGMAGAGELYLKSSTRATNLVQFTMTIREFTAGGWQDASYPDAGATTQTPQGQTFGRPPSPDHWDHFACDSWNNGLVNGYRVYHFVYHVTITPQPDYGPNGDGCPQTTPAIVPAPPFPPGAPTERKLFRIKSRFRFSNESARDSGPRTIRNIWIEYNGDFHLQDDRNTDAGHFWFTPDPNAHVYAIAAKNNGFMMFAGDDDGGGDLKGLFPGQVTPAGCLYRIVKGSWILEAVPGAPANVFYIRNQATGDRLRVGEGVEYGNGVKLDKPEGVEREQWELVP